MNSSSRIAAKKGDDRITGAPPDQRSHRSAFILVVGVALIALALWLRSSAWLRDYILKAKDVADLEAIVKSSPEDPIAHYHLAKQYYLSRRFDDAREQYDEAVRLDPKSSRAHLGLGLALFELGHPGASQEEFERALELDPRSAWAEYMIAKLAWIRGDPDSAQKHLLIAVELDPRSDQAW